MELVVIRHGETQANAEGRYQGALDIGLNDDGVRQISRLAEKVAVPQSRRSIGCWHPPAANKGERCHLVSPVGIACGACACLS